MEIAFITSNKLRFKLEKKQHNLTSAILGTFYKHPRQFISTMLVGNNIALIIYGLLMAQLLGPVFEFADNAFISTMLQIIVATLIVLFTGEFLPRTFFRINPNLWLRVFAFLLLFFYTLLYPIAWLSTWLSRVILNLFKPNSGIAPNSNLFSRVDLNYLIRESFDDNNEQTEIENEVRFLQNALDFSKIRLRDCSVPRTEIIAVDIDNTTVDVLKQTFIETGYSKLPVYKENIDNMIGYIHASEMFDQLKNWKKNIRQIPIVPENMSAHKLMKLFMQQRKSIAVVVDEHGGTDGIVTLEDIIEEIFGEIEDEHDTREYVVRKLTDNEFLLSGRMEVHLANERLGLNLPESDDYETIAGLILHHHRHFPTLNEVIKIHNISFQCIKATSNRIELVRLILGS